MKTSPEGIALIKKYEGLRLKAYPDPATGGDPWTIGYGTTSSAGVGEITRGMVITKVQAESLLIRSLDSYEQGILKWLSRTPTQYQFDAMVSFAYNAGVGAFSRSSIARFFNQGKIPEAANAFLAWSKGGKPLRVIPGLLKRRKAEKELFLKPDVAICATPAGKPKAR